jgi:hypothetical protein
MKGGYLLTNTPTNSLANLVNDILTKKKSYIFLLENKKYERNNIWATTIIFKSSTPNVPLLHSNPFLHNAKKIINNM